MTDPTLTSGEPLRWQITKPGVYQMTDAEYHADPVKGGSLSSTGARKLLPPSCPAKFDWERRHKQPRKPEFEFGRAAHHRVLGVGPEIVVLPYENWRTKDAQQERADAEAAGMIALLEHENQQTADMAEALAMDPIVGSWFMPDRGWIEQTLVWRDRRTKIMRRSRLDWISKGPTDQGRVIVADYKTCASADLDAIVKAVAKYGYHCQADFYLEGVHETGLSGPAGATFVLIFQEKTEPYLVHSVELDEEALMWGGELNRTALDIYKHCTTTGRWPGYSTTISKIELPRYAVNQYAEFRALGPLNIKEFAR